MTASLYPAAAQNATKDDDYLDFLPGRSTPGSEWVRSIIIKKPELRSEVKGNVKVDFQAPGMTVARALCWHQPASDHPNPFGYDTIVGSELKLDAQGNGSFILPADKYPNGPITVRILANNADSTKHDMEELQLFNKGGIVWNQGIPKNNPPAAKGMHLAFSDDFDGPLSISHDGKNAKYCSHKPGGGDFSEWPFSDFESPENPFSREGTFLRIHASKSASGKTSTGFISSARMDATGFYVTAPCYLECRFIAQSAPGTWPAFWTLSKRGVEDGVNSNTPADELDIIEAYGGLGQGNPNNPGYYTTSHFWNQPQPAGAQPYVGKRIDIMGLGGGSYWSTTFHTYGVKVTETDTTYYFDDILVFTHPTSPISKKEPILFMINYAIGGNSGWKVNLEREGNASYMWVDYVRAYQGVK